MSNNDNTFDDNRTLPRSTLSPRIAGIKYKSVFAGRLLLLWVCSTLLACTQNLFDTREAPVTSSPQVARPSVPDQTAARPNSKVAPAADESLGETPAGREMTDLWERIRRGYQFSEEHPSIDQFVAWFQANKDVIDKSSIRARPLLFHIVERIEALGLPAELALIPLLESGYRVHARSPFGAVGPWQFMPATGRQYGLTRTPYLDKRRDIVFSTQASLEYLQHLHQQFNQDWLLAIAAYNGGPGTVRKALGDSGQSFWHIAHRLPPETRQYVPKLLAAAKIIAKPEQYAQTLHPIPNRAFFESLQITGPTDFSVLEDLPDWDHKLFRRLNGSLNSAYFGEQKALNIRVPLGRADHVSEALAAAGPARLPSNSRHLVQPGDTLGAIAIRYNVPIGELRKLNGIRGHSIRAGKTLIIPDPRLATNAGTQKNTQHDHRHIVKPGDSFWTLGRRYAISARTLARHNGHALNSTLYPGQLLLIPKVSGGSTAEQTAALLGDYIVQRGDSLWSIAKRYQVKLADLKRWNPLLKNGLLQPGQKLVVQAP